MNKHKGFTLIELVIVVIILALLAAVAIPKFVNLADDAKSSAMRGMQASIISARDLTFAEMQVKPQNFNANGRRFTLDTDETILVRADYPDGRWRNNFEHIVHIPNVIPAVGGANSACENEGGWCARNRGSGWFVRNQNTASGGRGFVIYPHGFSVNEQACYVYYYTPNTANTDTPLTPVVGIDDSEC